ncbi:MAG: methylated-DNA--[protein]-cysteine S-methyltransferase [Eubacteriales bacterium]|nr:methylated-DNA--[protein]-cysteine S-methyltransferase [Eubacteriales bacterium]
MAKQRINIVTPLNDLYDAIISFQAGAIHVRANQQAIVAIEFVSRDFPGAARPGHQMIIDDAPPVLIEACKQFREYFDRKRFEFDLPLELRVGSDFQKKVWTQLAKIPYGATWSYEELAMQIVKPEQTAHQMARAVGAACAANPLPIVVPCHRVIGKNGRLVGFAGGIELKAYLLNLEMLGI